MGSGDSLRRPKRGPLRLRLVAGLLLVTALALLLAHRLNPVPIHGLKVAGLAGPYRARTTLGKLGASWDVEQLANRTGAIGHRGNPLRDWPNTFAALWERVDAAAIRFRRPLERFERKVLTT